MESNTEYSEIDASSPNWSLIDEAGQGNLAGIKDALDKGADVNFLYTSADGSWGAIHLAAYNGHLEAVNLLLEKNADIDSVAFFYEEEATINGTALHLAAIKNNTKIMSVLIDKGSNLNMSDGTYNYLTPLHSASRDGKLDAVKLLVEKGADVNALDGVGYTGVTLAAENGQLEVIKYLVSVGASINAESDVQTSLLAASENGHLEVVKYLLEKGINVNSTAKYRKDTALHVAAANNYEELVKFLLEKGADVKALNNDGKTPVDVATKEMSAVINSFKK